MKHTITYCCLCIALLIGQSSLARAVETRHLAILSSECGTLVSEDFPLGAEITLSLTPIEGFYFEGWSDEVTDNSRVLTLNNDLTLTAVFAKIRNRYVITLLPQNGGTATGGGEYFEDDEATLTAAADEGYEFVRWNDGDTHATRTITVIGNETYYPVFRLKEYNLRLMLVGCSTVHDATYKHGSTVTLNATAQAGQQFLRWSDGDTENSRTVTMIGDLQLAAYFAQENAPVINHTVTVNDAEGGTVTGGGEYQHGTFATLTATAYSEYRFVGWADGVSDNPRYVEVTDDITLTPLFALTGHEGTTINLSVFADGCSENIMHYAAGSVITLTATPAEDYQFKQWSDGARENPRVIVLNSAASYVAQFEKIDNGPETPDTPDEPYIYNIAKGSVSITTSYCGELLSGEYPIGATLTIRITEREGETFLGWSDGDKDNPRTLQVTGDLSLEALFSGTGTGLEELEQENSSSVTDYNAAPRKLLIGNHVYILMPDGRMYDARGGQVK